MSKRLCQFVMLTIVLFILAFTCYVFFFRETMIGCNCKKLPDTASLQSQMGEEFTTEAFLDWVSQTYKVSYDQISIQEDIFDDKTRELFYWEKNGIRYAANLEESTLAVLTSQYHFPRLLRPDAQCVVKCFGQPEQYRATYSYDVPGHALDFGLLYPDKGIIVDGIRYFSISQESPPSISTGFPMYSFQIRPSGTTEDFMYQAFYSSTVFT